MNQLDDLLASTREVGDLPARGFERGRNALDDAVRSTRPQRRARASFVAPASGAVVVAAAVAVVISLSGSPRQSSQTTPDAAGPAPTEGDSSGTGPSASAIGANGNTDSDNAVELTGYRVLLPANYKTGNAAVAADTNCTKDLHLTADETKRAVTTPNADCPLVITSVVEDVPAGADKIPGSNGLRTAYVVITPSTATSYIPAQLPDGSTVYVNIDWTVVDATDAALDQFRAQLVQLEHGLHVERTSPLQAESSGPRG